MGRWCSSIPFWESKIWKRSVSICQSLCQRNGWDIMFVGKIKRRKQWRQQIAITHSMQRIYYNSSSWISVDQHSLKNLNIKKTCKEIRWKRRYVFCPFYSYLLRLPWKSKHWAGNKDPGKASGPARRQFSSTEWKTGLCSGSSAALSQQRVSNILPSSNLQEQELNGYFEDSMPCLLLSDSKLSVSWSLHLSYKYCVKLLECLYKVWNHISSPHKWARIWATSVFNSWRKSIFLTSLSLLTLTNCFYLLVKLLYNILKVRVCG